MIKCCDSTSDLVFKVNLIECTILASEADGIMLKNDRVVPANLMISVQKCKLQKSGGNGINIQRVALDSVLIENTEITQSTLTNIQLE